MRVEKDFEKFIGLLNKHDVRYLIVGGYAFSFHAEPRFTKDIDFFVDSSGDNPERLLRTLNEFGFGKLGLARKDFLKSGQVVQLGVAPVRIDLMTSISGMDFATAWKNRISGAFGAVRAYFISKLDLIKNKMATGRKQDLGDIEKLKKI
jgi:hypothetical protein